MKFNQWTMALATLGVISAASVAQADEAKLSSVQTAVSSTTLSGFVDTSMQWNLGTGNSHAPSYGFGGAGKADGFNLNVVDLNLQKDPDATDNWGAGYKIELWMGPDAAALFTQSTGVGSDFAVKNAYVDLKAPVGTGLDVKVGVFDTIIGYEVADSINNPNFTRSWGFSIEPTTHTGVLLGYTVNEMIALQAGVANTYGPTINGRAGAGGTGQQAEYYKTYMASIALTAPKDWGFLAGSTLYGCIINGFNAASPGVGNVGMGQTSLYVGTTLNTPLKELKVGASYDYEGSMPQELSVNKGGHANAFDLYATYQASEKLSFNTRMEYFNLTDTAAAGLNSGTAAAPAAVPPIAAVAPIGIAKEIFSVTETIQYDLWKNVMSRVEFRWDRALGGGSASRAFGGGAAPTGASVLPGGGTGVIGTAQNSFEVIGSIAYKF